MYPIYDLKGIDQIESSIEEKHVIILLMVKPSDNNAASILNLLNYWHQKADKYCSIYIMGYSQNFMKCYSDIKQVKGPENETWEYSDKCFIDVCNALQNRLKKWVYSGEPELIVLQNNNEEDRKSRLDFRGYNYIDINYGIEHGYIDTFPRFMERFLNACKCEVEATKAISTANKSRINCRNVLEMAIESMPKLPKPAKKVLKDKLFYKSYRS